jgi:uncharacterized protein YcfJ
MNRRSNMKKLLLVTLFVSSVAQATEYGTVKTVEPSYIDVTVPQQWCTQVQEKSSGFNAGTVIGGVAGGIIGNQVGKGGGNTIATAIGTGVGAIVGQDLGNRGYETRQQCSTVYKTRRELSGYNATINYKGITIPAYLNYNPGVGSQVPVTIIVGE